MLAFAPRIPPRLVRELAKLDDRRVPIAETYRRLGERADRMGITRPSYERVRVLVHELRRLRPKRSALGVVSRLAVTARPFELILDHSLGVAVRRLE